MRCHSRQMHVRDGSGSGGIVSQMKASIESKAKAAAGSPSSAAVPNSTKQKINVSLAQQQVLQLQRQVDLNGFFEDLACFQ